MTAAERELERWQEVLARHFGELRSRRDPSASLFALEHGLDAQQVRSLQLSIRNRVTDGFARNHAHALSWIVYAAELGYRYAGNEYWQTFEQDTPGWAEHGDRNWIRECYRTFHRDFGGAEPEGPFAENFSIICWPITHAILPRDLQQQLALILYELRHSFTADVLESPTRLGQAIASRSFSASPRFQNLAEEPRLLGQIAAALLLQDGSTGAGLIHPPTLQRIRDDLDRERRARDWLRGARQLARERLHVRGLRSDGEPATEIEHRVTTARAEVVALGLEPRLLLRPTVADDSAWEVVLEIPDLSGLLLRLPRAKAVLSGSRCVVAGAAGRPLARGRCLHGLQRVVLSRWPRTDEVLLKFDDSDATLDFLLHTECLLRPGAIWLFRIMADGIAQEVRSLRIRPSERYLVVSTDGALFNVAHARPISVNCEHAVAAMLELPSSLDAAWEESLRSVGLSQSKTIEVWPAGLGAASWDGEGRGEWLASERPCLGIATDHEAGSLSLSLGEGLGASLEIGALAPGEAAFVELPLLPLGTHRVKLATRRARDDLESIGDLDVVMRIRDARPWSAGAGPLGPLLVQLDPASPTLEGLWEGKVSLAVAGPTGRRLKCRLSFGEGDGAPPILRKQLPQLTLPLSSSRWLAYLEQHVSKDGAIARAYDSARSCELAFSAEELGAFTVRCAREFTALRWSIARSNQGYVVMLFDDSGRDEPLRVVRRAFESPDQEEEVALEEGTRHRVPDSGGLYVARSESTMAGLIVPPVVHGLAALTCRPHIRTQIRSVDAIVSLLVHAEIWGRARISGDAISLHRQQAVLRAFADRIASVLGGDNWARAEDVFGSSSRADVLRAAITRQPTGNIGEVWGRQCATLVGASNEERGRALAGVSIAYFGVDRNGLNDGKPEWLSELALRMATDPASTPLWADDLLRPGIQRLLERVPPVFRAARYLVLLTDAELGSNASGHELYASWGWK